MSGTIGLYPALLRRFLYLDPSNSAFDGEVGRCQMSALDTKAIGAPVSVCCKNLRYLGCTLGFKQVKMSTLNTTMLLSCGPYTRVSLVPNKSDSQFTMVDAFLVGSLIESQL